MNPSMYQRTYTVFFRIAAACVFYPIFVPTSWVLNLKTGKLLV